MQKKLLLIFYWATPQFGVVWGQEHMCKIKGLNKWVLVTAQDMQSSIKWRKRVFFTLKSDFILIQLFNIFEYTGLYLMSQ